jgi:hypothetical protein
MLVNRFKFNEGVIKLGSNSRKYQKEATGNRKVPTEVTGNMNSRKYQQEENQQQVRGKEKSHLKKGTPPMSQHLSLGVGSPSGTTRGRALKHNSNTFYLCSLHIGIRQGTALL